MTLLLLPPNYYGAICDMNLYFCKQSVLHFSEIWGSLCVMDISFSLWSFFAPFTGTSWYWAVSFQLLCHPAFQHEILNCSSWNICRKCHYMKFTFGLLLSFHCWAAQTWHCKHLRFWMSDPKILLQRDGDISCVALQTLLKIKMFTTFQLSV